jgi:anaerobic selenocysteine-containing dehydrogenase
MFPFVNDRRALEPYARRPGSDQWEGIAWDQAYVTPEPGRIIGCGTFE